MRYILLVCALWGIQPVSAQDDSFADNLYQSGEFSAAALEYYRLLFGHLNESRTPFWQYRLGRCKMQSGHPEQASRILARISDPSWADRARFMQARCYLMMERPAIADSVLATTCVEEAPIFRAYACLMQSDFTRADAHLKKVGPQSRLFPASAQLRQINDSLAHWKQRSYVVGGLLSIIPGLGHLYANRQADAVSSFLMVGSLGALAGYYAVHGSDLRAAVAGGAAMAFYAGNIYGALVSVKLVNTTGPANLRLRAERLVNRL